MRLKWGVRWKLRSLFFPLRCANDIHSYSICSFSHLSVSHSLVEVWLSIVWLLALCVVFQPLDQSRSLCWCYFVHVAAQLGHTLLKTCTLYGKESRSTGLCVMKAYHRSMSLHVTGSRVCNKEKTPWVRECDIKMLICSRKRDFYEIFHTFKLNYFV